MLQCYASLLLATLILTTHTHTHILLQEDSCAPPYKSPPNGLISSLRSLLCSPKPKNGARLLPEQTLDSAGNSDPESSSSHATDDELNSRIGGLSVECCLNRERRDSIVGLNGVVGFSSTGFFLEEDDDDVS